MTDPWKEVREIADDNNNWIRGNDVMEILADADALLAVKDAAQDFRRARTVVAHEKQATIVRYESRLYDALAALPEHLREEA